MAVHHPDNELTRMIEMAAAQNRSGVRGGVASSTPLPTARSADLGHEVPDLPPLTMEEQAELNQLAAAAGVKDDRIGTAEPEGAYPTMEAALAASAPVHGGMLPASKNLFERPGRHIMVNAAPRMPDFSRPATFDLADGVVIIDGMEFVLPDQLRDELRVKAVEVAREYLMKKLTEALDFMRTTPMTAEVENGGTESRVDEAVQQQPPGSSAEPQV